MEYDKNDLGLPSWPVIEGKKALVIQVVTGLQGKVTTQYLDIYSVYFEWGSITLTLASFLRPFLWSKPNNVLWKTIWDAARSADRGPYNGLFNYGLL